MKSQERKEKIFYELNQGSNIMPTFEYHSVNNIALAVALGLA